MSRLTIIDPSNLRDGLSSLVDAENGVWASVTMPVERAWNGAKKNRMQLRNLLDDVRDEASWMALEATDIVNMLAPATDLLEASSFWNGDLRGVALFLAPDTHVALRLPFAPSVFSAVDRQVHLRSLWRHLEPDGGFYILGLSAGGVALYGATRYHIQEIPLEKGPTTLDEVLQYDEHVRSLQYHTGTSQGAGAGGRRSALFFGHEDAGDKRYVKEGVLRFFRALDNQVRDVLGRSSTATPLVLAGIEGLRGLYRKVNQYPHVLNGAIETSVIDPVTREWNAEALHQRAWEIVRFHFDQDRRDALDRFHANPERTAGNPGSVLLAAQEGRVDTLFVAEVPMVWGRFDEEAHTVRVHEERQAEDIEFLNAATTAALRADGTVYVTDAAALPEDGPIAALLRY